MKELKEAKKLMEKRGIKCEMMHNYIEVIHRDGSFGRVYTMQCAMRVIGY